MPLRDEEASKTTGLLALIFQKTTSAGIGTDVGDWRLETGDWRVEVRD
jgi:hypothetical protein